MIIATVAALLIIFGGSAGGFFGQLMTKYAEDPIKNTITDEQRRELALEGLSLLNNDIENFNEQISDDIEQFGKLIKNYESTSEDFDNTFSSMLAKRQDILDKIWEHRSTMLVHIQPEEWKTIINSAKAEAQQK